MKKSSGDPTSAYVGERIKVRRRSLGYTLKDLAMRTGISIQMCSKYEQGVTQIFPDALLKISGALSISVDLLFPQNPNRLTVSLQQKFENGLGITKPVISFHFVEDLFYRRETSDFIDAFYELPTPELRKAIRAMIRTIASELPRTKAVLGLL